jgi:hypothetical protein
MAEEEGMDPKSSTDNIHPIRSGRGIQEAQVWEAADALLQDGLRPTIERVRQKIGSGSPNTVSPMLERWFATLGKRLEGRGGTSLVDGEAQKLPLAMIQAAQQIWDVARREADQVQIQKAEATRRELELQRSALTQKEADLQQREASFEQARAALDEALASSRHAVTVIEAQMNAQQQESTRLLGDSQAEVRRLRKALDEAVASKEALREKSAMELSAKQRAADEAEERHLGQERRLLSEIDRERMATRHANAELAKAQKAHTADLEAGSRRPGSVTPGSSRREGGAPGRRKHVDRPAAGRPVGDCDLARASRRRRAAGNRPRSAAAAPAGAI